MSNSPGQRLRTRLEIITIRKVLHFWEQLWPDKQLPHEALATAEAMLQGTIDVEVAEQIAWEMSGQLDDRSYAVKTRVERELVILSGAKNRVGSESVREPILRSAQNDRIPTTA